MKEDEWKPFVPRTRAWIKPEDPLTLSIYPDAYNYQANDEPKSEEEDGVQKT